MHKILEPAEILDRIIYPAIDEINAQNPEKPALAKKPETVLFGSGSQLDSLGLVNLIVTIEEKIERQTETTVTLADEKAMSQKRSPFRSVDTLKEYIHFLLAEQPGA